MNQKQLLTQVQTTSLMALDLHLFLDTHPDNKEALEYYQKLCQQFQTLRNQYEQQYGPLLNFGNQSEADPKKWISEPWPWQNK